jgi:CubicO group peptidase (beta-lactamase class C family)
MNISGNDLALAKSLQEHLKSKIDHNGAGISAAIIINGELVAACAAGVRGTGSTIAETSDIYNIGSVSKVYCAAAIMKLVELRKLKLDDLVIKYLPHFKTKDMRYKQITIRMTLNHTSGLAGTNYRKAIMNRWCEDDYRQEYNHYWLNSKMKAKPGEFSVYCNDGFELAAEIVENVSGMSYIDFLRNHITVPTGALSTDLASNAISTKSIMSCIGKKPEYIRALGAGSIRTSLTDCARFGYLFVESKGFFQKKNLDETAKKQGKTFLKHDEISPYFGLGWDSVEFKTPHIDLGKHVLSKGGTTSQFSSLLIVSPEYKLSAAISGTIDCKTNNTEILCELIAMSFKELSIDFKFKKQVQLTFKKKAIPKNVIDKYSGIFLSGRAILKSEFIKDQLLLWQYDGNDKWSRHPLFPNLDYNGKAFYVDGIEVFVEEHNDICYLIVSIDVLNIKNAPFAQKAIIYPEISKGWKNRIGRKYLACNISPSDLNAFLIASINIESLEKNNVIVFSFNEGQALTAISDSDTETEMIVNTPGLGARDTYAPFMFTENGIEYLNVCQYKYIHINDLKSIKSCRITSAKKEENIVYRMTAGNILEFSRPDDVEVLMFDEELVLVYNSINQEKMPETCSGFIVFINDGPMDFDIKVSNN